MYISRKIEKTVLEELAYYPIVAITGPRQSGKTTLCKHLFPNYQYFSFEDPDVRSAALADPRGFFANISREGVIFDEIQRAPDLLSYLQGVVDSENEMGRIILTGSAQLELVESITQSLAGRVSMLSLLPFQLSEMQPGSSDTDGTLLKGSFPASIVREIPATSYFRNYVSTFVERDVRQLKNITDLSAFQKLLELLAGRAGNTFDYSDLGGAVGVSAPTIRSWMSVLEAAYIIFLLPSYHGNLKKRVIKSPKLYFYDTGLLCFLLGIQDGNQIRRDPLRGHIFENFVVAEVFKQNVHENIHADLFFYRDSHQNEVDLLVKRGSSIVPIEIKSSQTFSKSFLKSINYFVKLLPDKTTTPKVLYDGAQEYEVNGVGIKNFRNFHLLSTS